MKIQIARAATRLKKNDVVYALSGKDKGKKGKILEIQSDRNRAIVEGLNFVKRHTRPTQANPQGGISQKEASIHLSNLGIFCSTCDRPVRVGVRRLENGEKQRICRKCGENI